jgi:5'-nucleotidase
MHECVRSDCGREIYKYFHAKGTFGALPLISGAKKAIDTFLDLGHEVYFVTKPVDHSYYCLFEKQKWVDYYFPDIGHKKIIFTGQKHMIVGDVLIDDMPYNLVNFPKCKVLMDRPWNRNVEIAGTGIRRLSDWEAVSHFILTR